MNVELWPALESKRLDRDAAKELAAADRPADNLQQAALQRTLFRVRHGRRGITDGLQSL